MQWYQHSTGGTLKRGKGGETSMCSSEDARVPLCGDKEFKAEFGKLFRASASEEEDYSEEAMKRRSVCRGRRRGVISRTRGPSSPVLAQLADLLTERYGSYRLAFKAIASSNMMFLGDWEIALQSFAPDLDAAVLFRYLDKEFKEGVSLAEFQQVFQLQRLTGCASTRSVSKTALTI